MSDNIVFIHGAWLASNSWDNFAAFFSERGYTTLAPEWPRKAGDVSELRSSAEDLAGLGVQEIVDHYATIIAELPESPIIIGHSFGGLITQILNGKGLGRAAVAMDPAAPKGIRRVPLSSLRAAAPAIAHPSKRRGVVELDFEQFNYAFTNTWDAPEARAAFERYAVPETGRIFFEDGFANFTCTLRRRSTSSARTAARCCSRWARTITPSRRRSRGRTSTSTVTRPRRRTSSSFPAARTCS